MSLKTPNQRKPCKTLHPKQPLHTKAMLARLIASHSRHFRYLSTTLSPYIRPSSPFLSPQIPKFHSSTHFISRLFSTNDNNNNGEKPTSGIWKIGEKETNLDDLYDTHNANSIAERRQDEGRDLRSGHEQKWAFSETADEGDGGLPEPFVEQESGGTRYPVAESESWKMEGEREFADVYDVKGGVDGDGMSGEIDGVYEKQREMISEAQKLELEKEEHALMDILKGPNRAFGDLVAQSGITDEMLDSLIALKNFQDIEGLPPLTQIEEERYEKTQRKSSNYEMELEKKEKAAESRVRKADENGRAYGTGKRKSSIARVWIQPGQGKFLVNDREYDVYFPMLEHRAIILRPFTETKTLGLWDVQCTVKGGGDKGKAGAIRLGVSRALQNWEPGLRTLLRNAGFLTRDSRIVERKKPGRAKARKSFQWVKR